MAREFYTKKRRRGYPPIGRRKGIGMSQREDKPLNGELIAS